MSASRILLVSSLVAIASFVAAPEAKAACQGDCVNCYYDEFFTPYCVLVEGSGFCYCQISYIYAYCQGVLQCRIACVYPFCSEARCQEAPAGMQRHPEAGAYESTTFRPYFRPTPPTSNAKGAALEMVALPQEGSLPHHVAGMGA